MPVGPDRHRFPRRVGPGEIALLPEEKRKGHKVIEIPPRKDEGGPPAIEADGRRHSADDRRRVSIRWLLGTVLTGLMRALRPDVSCTPAGTVEAITKALEART